MASDIEFAAVRPDAALLKDVRFRFVGEGAANIVFEAIVPDSYAGDNPFKEQLLRVPKTGTKAYSHGEIQQYWQEAVKPEFEDDQLVQQSLIQLAGTDLVPRLNDALATVDGRREDFKDSKVADVDFGMLVEDMRERNPGDFVLEFKPKWMAQSPNAPKSASRCRNCAREAYRNQKNGVRSGLFTDAAPCPLVALLCSEDSAVPEESLRHIATLFNPDASTMDNKPTTRQQQLRFGGWLRYNPLLKRLHKLQAQHDPMGPLYADPAHPGFPLAMTLRDCTCFVRIPADIHAPVEAKLGDLDKKNVDVKWKYWREMEERLAEEGYYERREQPAQRTRCLYEWAEWFPTPKEVERQKKKFKE